MATLGLKEMEKFIWEGWEKEEKVGKREQKLQAALNTAPAKR